LTDSVSMNFSIIVSRGRRYKVAKCRSDFSASCNSQPLSSSTFPYHVILNWPESKFQWWILSWADTSKINNVVGYWAVYLLLFSLVFSGIPWAGTELPSQASPAGERERHRAWTGTCSISWRLSPFQASSGGCTATWGTSYLAFSNFTRHTQAHTDTDM